MGGPVVVTPRWRARREWPLSRPWRELEYVVVDVETTGLDLKRDAIASYGAVVIRDGRIVVAENTYGLVCPSCEMTAESITVHTLRRADVADAPPLSRAVQVLDTLLRGRVLVAHAAWIERAFLAPRLLRARHRTEITDHRHRGVGARRGRRAQELAR